MDTLQKVIAALKHLTDPVARDIAAARKIVDELDDFVKAETAPKADPPATSG